jgi:hypothetical protein
MKRTSDQLLDETTYPNLAAFLRSGGILEIGGNRSGGNFAQISKGNQAVTVDAEYRDFAAVLKEMEATAKSFLDREYEHRKASR